MSQIDDDHDSPREPPPASFTGARDQARRLIPALRGISPRPDGGARGPGRRRLRRLQALLGGLTLIVVAAVAAGTLAFADTDDGTGHELAETPSLSVVRLPASLAAHPTATLGVLTQGASAPMPAGFLGLSLEYSALLGYAGRDARAADPLLVRLIAALNPGQHVVLRIGGYSADRSWWPVPGMRWPKGIRYALTPRLAAVLRTLVTSLNGRLILDINLQQGRPRVAAQMARQLVRRIGAGWIEALEIGNEPNTYAVLPYYHRRRRYFYARRRGYDFADYAREWAATTARLPWLPLAGPATSGFPWLRPFLRLAARNPRVTVVTLHRYPLNRCFTPPDSPRSATIPHLLDPANDATMIGALPLYAARVHALGRRLRVDELNSVACSGQRGVSDTFASALWSLDALFSLFRAGVDGVNVHTFPGAVYAPFRLWRAASGWRGLVQPLYYGLLMFSRAATPGSRLLTVADSGPSSLGSWATIGGGRIRVVLVNDSPARREVVRLAVPAAGWGLLERLTAPGLAARTGVRLGGQSFGSVTRSGRLVGALRVGMLPRGPSGYVLELPPASAALVTFTAAPAAGH